MLLTSSRALLSSAAYFKWNVYKTVVVSAASREWARNSSTTQQLPFYDCNIWSHYHFVVGRTTPYLITSSLYCYMFLVAAKKITPLKTTRRGASRLGMSASPLKLELLSQIVSHWVALSRIDSHWVRLSRIELHWVTLILSHISKYYYAKN